VQYRTIRYLFGVRSYVTHLEGQSAEDFVQIACLEPQGNHERSHNCKKKPEEATRVDKNKEESKKIDAALWLLVNTRDTGCAL
jgi:hypothetical protein